MDEVVKTFLELSPYAAWVALAIIATWFVSITYHKARSAYKKAEETNLKINSLPCDAHREKLSSQDIVKHIVDTLPCEEHRQKIGDLVALNGKVDVILGLMQQEKSVLNLVQGHSPLSLTDKGKEIALELEMEKLISQNWDSISRYIESNAGSMNPYDVQQLCFNYVLKNPIDALTDLGYNNLKLKAFNIGTSSAGLLQIASIIIRDKYFEDHRINIFDIDKHDPASK